MCQLLISRIDICRLNYLLDSSNPVVIFPDRGCLNLASRLCLCKDRSRMYDSEFRPSQVWGVLVRDWKVDFISDSNLNPAIEMISRACLGLADERRPTCLAPVGLEDKPPFAPIDCGRRANRGSHSIQRNGPLADIAISRGSGPSVPPVFPQRPAVDESHSWREKPSCHQVAMGG